MLKEIIYLSNEDYLTLIATGSVTISGETITYDPDILYATPDIVASHTEDGLMSADDKVKLDSLDLSNLVTLNDAQTISGQKTFSVGPILNNNIYLNAKDNSGTSISLLVLDNNNHLSIGNSAINDIKVYNSFRPDSSKHNAIDLGTNSYKWKDLYLAGNLSDGTNSISVADIASHTEVENSIADTVEKLERGEIIPANSQLADNFTPYSEDSGASQENPFISNGTGTNNNTEIVTVGDYGLLKEKQGNTLVVNQMVNPSAYMYETHTENSVTATYNKTTGAISFSGTASADTTFTLFSTNPFFVQKDHNYLVNGCPINGSLNTFYLKVRYNDLDRAEDIGKGAIFTNDNDRLVNALTIIVKSGTNMNGVSFLPKLFDLTQMFGSNDLIPQDLLDNPSHFSWYYNGDLSYNEGSLVNANGVKLVSTGRNICDEVFTFNGDNLVSSNYIKVKNGITYYLKSPKNVSVKLYDINQNFIDNLSWAMNTTKTFGDNVGYIKFEIGSYGTTYNHDITISLYYTPAQGGEGYDKYYPYETPYVVDTGTEVLRKAGIVKDYKEPNGTIHRLVGVVDLGSLNWEYVSSWGTSSIMKANLPLAKKPSSNNVNFVGICDKYSITNITSLYANTSGKQIALTYEGVLVVVATSSSDIPTGTLYYELATPTTEQGTPFAENLPINDYGMLYWLDENDNLVGIPQGAKIFYPTNYKGFVDDMYSRVDGDSSAYVVQEELSAEETARSNQDTILQNAIGGTLRQLLASSQSVDFLNTKVLDLSTLTFVRVTSRTNPFFYADISDAKTEGKCLTTMYKSISSVGGATFGDNANNMECCLGMNSSQVIIRNDSYTDATAFKNAMKGILLAYEKASF